MLKAAAADTSNGGQLVPLKPGRSREAILGRCNCGWQAQDASKEVGFQVMVGAAHQLEPSLAMGAVGRDFGVRLPAPMACYEIYAALKEGDHALAAKTGSE